ncbi:YggS family pyridoxal phosphate enzyme, partial [Campylobacter upsaliensis]|nr:YggS family pyridoxal phosphate enzyme [Campylobacter upsaliensis]
KLQKHGANICSMGMSNDFELALKCGSNMLRLGSILFKSP